MSFGKLLNDGFINFQKIIVYLILNYKKENIEKLENQLLTNNLIEQEIIAFYIRKTGKTIDLSNFVSALFSKKCKSISQNNFKNIVIELEKINPQYIKTIENTLLEELNILRLVDLINYTKSSSKRRIFLGIVKKYKQNNYNKYLIDYFVYYFPEFEKIFYILI